MSFVSPPPQQTQTPSWRIRQAKPRTYRQSLSTANRTSRQDTTAHDTRQSSVSWSIPLVTLPVSASAHVVSVDKTRQDKISSDKTDQDQHRHDPITRLVLSRAQNLSRLVGPNLDLLIPPLTLTSLRPLTMRIVYPHRMMQTLHLRMFALLCLCSLTLSLN